MANNISNRQILLLVFIAVTTTYSIIDMPKYMAQSFGRSSWLPIIAGAVVFAAAAFVIATLNSMYPNKVFFDYTKEITGRFIAGALAVLYILYFIIVEVNLNVKLVGILSSNFLPKTPHYVFLIISISLSAYLSSKGIRNICRLIEFTGIAFFVVTVLVCLIMITNGDKFNILPFFNKTDFNNLAESVREILLPFAGIEILLIVPFTKENKGIGKKVFVVLALIGLFYILIVESTIKILGLNNTILLNDSFFEAIKSTPAPIIERLDIIYLTFGLGSLFTGFGVIFTAIIEHMSRLLPKVNRILLIVIISVIVFAISFVGIKVDSVDIVRILISYLVVVVGILIPLILLIVAKIKNKKKPCCIKENTQ